MLRLDYHPEAIFLSLIMKFFSQNSDFPSLAPRQLSKLVGAPDGISERSDRFIDHFRLQFTAIER